MVASPGFEPTADTSLSPIALKVEAPLQALARLGATGRRYSVSRLCRTHLTEEIFGRICDRPEVASNKPKPMQFIGNRARSWFDGEPCYRSINHPSNHFEGQSSPFPR